MSTTASKYATSLPPLIPQPLVKGGKKNALQALRDELETYKAQVVALSSHSTVEKSLKPLEESKFNISFDPASLWLSFDPKGSACTLIAHSSTAPFCLSYKDPALEPSSNGTQDMPLYDPTELLPVTHVIEAQGPISCQVFLPSIAISAPVEMTYGHRYTPFQDAMDLSR